MAFDKPTRNRLASFVNDARRVIADEFTLQFQGLYGISERGGLTPLDQLGHLDDAGLATAAMLRERIDYLVKIHPDDKDGASAAVARLAREQAFTILNRLAAIRMAEKRGLIVESVGNGYQSKGFKVFEQVAGSGLGDTYHRYRRYLFCLFDEIAVDLGLFDRRSPQGLLFPREAALQEFLILLNAPDLDSLWAEDETIGWIYQYYNDPAERKKMREDSPAPRNSRELAVRNQFFTPRYVVEFLTDNTLGRIWYEMTQGQTRLKDQCRYLVRRPTEIFLKPGEVAAETPPQDGLSQEELLKQPVYIPHRPLKDPREIRLLDPACGSMHFGLYAFDLFEVIYEEAWDLGMESLRRDYPNKDDFLREVPRLIIEHNIHGIDIDPRAVQIAGLSLWLRAQKSWQAQCVPAAQRPRILRSNIVCAEPMPGSPELLKEFTATLRPPLLGQLVEKVFAHMLLAGEAGSLLKIEEEIGTLVKDAKKLWQSRPQAEQLKMGFALEAESKQGDLPLDISGISDDRFWETAEERIYAALRSYAEHAESGGYLQRLFAEDAARGFAFIDLCRKRYDVVVMNPPFGAACDSIKTVLAKSYFTGRTDLYTCMILRALGLLSSNGTTGAITARTGFFLQSFSQWRSSLLERASVACFADLGGEVLDSAMVETAAYVLTKSPMGRVPFFRIEPDAKNEVLADAIRQLASGSSHPTSFITDPNSFAAAPDKAWSYWISPGLLRVISKHNTFEPHFGDIRLGVQTNDDFRFSRLWWEVDAAKIRSSSIESGKGKGWVTFLKGGDSSKYFTDIAMLLNWLNEGEELKAAVTIALGGGHWSRHIQSVEYYFLQGISWALRTDNFDAHAIPAGCISSISRYFAIPKEVPIFAVLAVWNTRVVDFLAKLRMEKWLQPKFVVGVIKDLPFPKLTDAHSKALSDYAAEIWNLKCLRAVSDESSRYFVRPCFEPSLSVADYCNAHSELLAENNRRCERLQCDSEDSVNGMFGFAADVLSRLPNTAESVTQRKAADNEALSPEDAMEAVSGYAFGCSFGRWDIRFATDEKGAPELPNPFAPLPVCPPGQLLNEQGLPITKEEVGRLKDEDRWNYPIEISWDGILVDDPGHSLDLEARVQQVLQVVWKDRWEAIEREVCEILGVRSLRDYFRKPAGFFADHLKRYSKSRRQAPIYWPLSSAKGSYTLWIYYHRLSEQTLHTALADFVDPKLKSVRAEISALRESATHRDRLEELQDLERELDDFHAEIERIIKLPWKPNLNDGVLITGSPLWKLFRLPKWQKDLKACWEKLEKGDYDWAHLTHSIWPNRVEEVCKHDRSIAIAHNLEHLCKIEPPKPKARRAKKQLK
jgi:hypothetical protein